MEFLAILVVLAFWAGPWILAAWVLDKIYE